MSWRPSIAAAKRELRRLHADHCARVALFVHRGVSLRSPVDKGTFRASWTISHGSPDTSVAPIGGSLAQFNTLPARLPDFPVIFVNNQLPYGPRLERGWSDQAPLGMVGLTVQAAVEFGDRFAVTPQGAGFA